MKEFISYIKKHWISIIAMLFSLVVALFWTALRINYAGISKVLGADKNDSFFVMWTPVLILVFLWLAFVYSVFNLVYFKDTKKVYTIVSYSISGLFLIGIVIVVIFGSFDYLSFILPHFYKSLIISFMLLVIVVILFFPIENNKKSLIVKGFLVVVITLGSVLVGYNVKSNSINYKPVVYAVEDEYQIIYSTSDNSIAWVEVNGEKYYDLYAGSMKSKDLVHKISVPMEKLDAAKSYKIYAQQLIYRGPFGGIKGDILSETYNFKPVDSSDGIEYYAISDVHESFTGAINAANYFADEMDFLVIIGDTTSMIETEAQANADNTMAYKITKGEKPVIYARGNHEVKGEYAEDLYKYVGSKDSKFYYTFRFKDVFGIVLDLGEDHDDDWWEYYETAQFDLYRQEQTEFLQNLIDTNALDGYKYKLALSHIPVVFVNNRLNHESFKNDWTGKLNQLHIDTYLSGHQHDLSVFEPGKVTPETTLIINDVISGKTNKAYNGYLTDFNFVGYMVARAANSQLGDTQAVGVDEFTGLYTKVDLVNNTQYSKYTNAKGETVEVYNRFTQEDKVESYTFTIGDH